MATTHFARSVYKGRGEVGRAAARVRYILREEPEPQAEGLVDHHTKVHGTEDIREDLVCAGHGNLPTWAGDNPVTFFSAAERYEFADNTAYEEWKLSLPRELTRDQQIAAAQDLLQGFFGDLHPYVWAMHDPMAADGGSQPHIHTIFSARTLDGIDRDPGQFFRRYNRQHPERGGAEKSRQFSHLHAVKAARVYYTDVMNMHLERAGQQARLHPESLITRGIDREPEPRMDPSDSNAAKVDHKYTDKMREVLSHRRKYGEAKVQEQEAIQAYWEARKQTLGITMTMEPNEAIQALRVERERQVSTPDKQAPQIPVIVPAQPDQERLDVPLIGNRQSKIYHAPGEPNYGDVRPGNQVWFWTVADAVQAGYRAAKNQHHGRGSEVPMAGESRLHAQVMMQMHRERQVAQERPHAQPRFSPLPHTPGRQQSVHTLTMDDDLSTGGLHGPDLDRKRGRDGFSW
jgi:hypothetical protein